MRNKKLSPNRCSKWVHSNARWDIGGHQCCNKPVKNGLCKIHQPEYIAERIKKKNEADDKRQMIMPYHSRNEMNRVKAQLVKAEEKNKRLLEAGNKLLEVVRSHWGVCDEIEAWDKALGGE